MTEIADRAASSAPTRAYSPYRTRRRFSTLPTRRRPWGKDRGGTGRNRSAAAVLGLRLGGRAGAGRHLRQSRLVAGKRVLDFASGSGLVAIAAALAGAASVEASEIDPSPSTRSRSTRRPTGWTSRRVRRHHRRTRDGTSCWRAMSPTSATWRRASPHGSEGWPRGATVLIGDPGRSYLAREKLVAVAEYRVPVTRALEDPEIKQPRRSGRPSHFRRVTKRRHPRRDMAAPMPEKPENCMAFDATERRPL